MHKPALLMSRTGHLTLMRLIFHCHSLHSKSKDKLLDLNCNVFSTSDRQKIGIEGRRHCWTRQDGWQKFKGILEEKRFDRSMKASLPLYDR